MSWTKEQECLLSLPSLYSELRSNFCRCGNCYICSPLLPFFCWLPFLNKWHQVGLKTWRVIDKMLTTTCSYLQEWKATVSDVFITISFQGCTQIQLIFEWRGSFDKRRLNFLSIYTNFCGVILSSRTCKLNKSWG